jgi:hypothetical protein
MLKLIFVNETNLSSISVNAKSLSINSGVAIGKIGNQTNDSCKY